MPNTQRVIRGPWARRQYKGGGHDRFTGDFPSASGDINRDVSWALPTLRARCRGLEQNSDLARRYLSLVETHVVGPQGFRFQSRGVLRNGNPDKRGNDAVESAWRAFCRRGVCELTGRLSLPELVRLVVRGVARDGEALIRIHDIDEDHGIALEALDPVRLDLNYHDERGGRRIRYGVELDRRNRALAYYLRDEDLDLSTEHRRVPAENLIHLYRPDRPEQLRGVPWMASAMRRLHMLGEFEDEALAAARYGARTLGFIQPSLGGSLAEMADALGPDGGSTVLQSLYGMQINGDGELERGHDPMEVHPEVGAYRELPPGFTVVPTETQYPDGMVESFTRGLARTAAQGLGVSYHALTGDLTNVNFSSIRAGTLEEREHWMELQFWVIDALMLPIYRRWLPSGLAAGVVGLPGAMAMDEALRRYAVPEFMGRRWPWVDPLKDAQAITHLMGAGLASPRKSAAQQGVDIDDVMQDLSDYYTQAEALGVPLSLGTTMQADRPAAPKNDQEDGADAD